MFARKVRTASGAVAVQVMRKAGRRDVLVEHVGSAHTDAELGILLECARRIATGDQDVLDFEVSARAQRVADVRTTAPTGCWPRSPNRCWNGPWM